MDDSSTRGGPVAVGRRPGRALAAVTAVVVALAIGLALLAVSCTPEQRASAVQAEVPTAAPVEEASTVGAVAPVETTATVPSEPANPGEPAVSVEAAVPAITSPAALEVAPPDVHASLTDRSGQRADEEVELTLETVTVSEKLANARAQLAEARALAAAANANSLALSTGVQQATPTPKPVVRAAAPTPKPVVRAAAATPKPVVRTATPRPVTSPSGGWVELPNVRPIPSTYYAAVHQWDSIVNHFASAYRIDPDLIRRIIYVESKGYQYAYNGSTGVKGLMQITPSWFKAGENPYDPWTNIGKGAYILRAGYDAYHTWFLAVTWYCYGPLGRYGGNVPTFYAGLVYSPIIRSL